MVFQICLLLIVGIFAASLLETVEGNKFKVEYHIGFDGSGNSFAELTCGPFNSSCKLVAALMLPNGTWRFNRKLHNDVVVLPLGENPAVGVYKCLDFSSCATGVKRQLAYLNLTKDMVEKFNAEKSQLAEIQAEVIEIENEQEKTETQLEQVVDVGQKALDKIIQQQDTHYEELSMALNNISRVHNSRNKEQDALIQKHHKKIDGNIKMIKKLLRTSKGTQNVPFQWRGDACPVEWSQLGKYCFKVMDAKYTWFAAQSACENVGGYLAEAQGFDQHTLIVQLIKKASKEVKGKCFWLGLQEMYGEGRWMWAQSGRAVDPGETHWRNGQPDNQGGQEDCAMLCTDGKWNDARCGRDDAEYWPICQRFTN